MTVPKNTDYVQHKYYNTTTTFFFFSSISVSTSSSTCQSDNHPNQPLLWNTTTECENNTVLVTNILECNKSITYSSPTQPLLPILHNDREAPHTLLIKMITSQISRPTHCEHLQRIKEWVCLNFYSNTNYIINTEYNTSITTVLV